MKQFKRIYIEITNICNLSCSFCPKSSRKHQYMSLKDFEHILSEISPYTDYVYLHVKGEPLLHPELQEILSLCEKYHMHANITTNGTLLKTKKEILYHASSLRQVNISLHSFEEGTFLSTHNTEQLEIYSQLHAYLESIITYAKYMSSNTNTITALRLWNLEDNTLIGSDTMKKKNAYVLSLLEHAFQTEIVPEKISRGVKLMDRVFLNQDYHFEWPSMEIPVQSTSGYCYGLGTQTAILVDGSVIPCCLDNEGDITLGNIHESSFSDILTCNRATAMINGFKNRTVVEELCKRCGYRHRFM